MARRIIGQVQNDKFVSGKPTEIGTREHSGHKEFNRLSMREKYARDIEQPFKHGEPNPGYIEAFGKHNAIKEGLVEAPNYGNQEG